MITALAECEAAVREAAVQRLLHRVSSSPKPPGQRAVGRLAARVAGGELRGAFTGGGCLVRPVPRSRGRYALCVPLPRGEPDA